MAKITIEFDTVSKECTIKQDGEELSNIESVRLEKAYYRDNEDKPYPYRMELCEVAEDKENKMYKINKTYASKTKADELKDIVNKATGID